MYHQTIHVCVSVCVCMLLLTCMSQAEGPEAQIGSCVGDASQTVLYGVDGLVDSYVTKVKLWRKDETFSWLWYVFFLHLVALNCFIGSKKERLQCRYRTELAQHN